MRFSNLFNEKQDELGSNFNAWLCYAYGYITSYVEHMSSIDQKEKDTIFEDLKTAFAKQEGELK